MDIERARSKQGKMTYKALTDKGRAFLGEHLGGPWQMAAEVFLLTEDEAFMAKAAREGISVKEFKPKPIDPSQYTDF